MAQLTLKEQAYIQLREFILNGELQPGEILTERTLVELLGMSRTPIRAALERLDVEGLANYTPNKGLVVAELSMKRVVDLYDYRIALECHIVRKLSVMIWEERDLLWMEENLKAQQSAMQSEDLAAFTTADSQFHRKLSQLYGNAEMEHAMEQLQDKLYQVALRVLRKDRNRIRVSYEDHARVFACMREGKADEAAAAMEQHLEFGKRILIM